MANRHRMPVSGLVVLLLLAASTCVLAQREQVAVFVQAAAAVPTADLETVKNYAMQQCSVVAGVNVCSQGEMMQAQRLTETYVGNGVTVEGVQRLANALDAHHIVVIRLVRWETQISYKPERSLLLLGATSFLDSSVQLILGPLGLIFGIEKQATASVFVMVFNAAGDLEFTTTATFEDRPLLSLLTADPLQAAKGAIDSALYQVAVTL